MSKNNPSNFNPYYFNEQQSNQFDEYQREFQNLIRHTPLVFCDAPSGTGKTLICAYEAMRFLGRGFIHQFIYFRFPDDRYHKNGLFPGMPDEKLQFLYDPLYQALTKLGVGEQQIKNLIETEQLKLCSDFNFRGTNLDEGTFLMIDEAQNARTVSDLQLVLTRLHDKNTRTVVAGHTGQQDNSIGTIELHGGMTPFQLYKRHMLKQPFAAEAILVNNYRGEISRWADNIQETMKECNA